MPRVTSKSKSLSRADVVNLLREELVRRADGEKSACRVAAEEGIFCHGFARYTDLELRRRYDWIARRHPKMTREELEEVADRWQMARQDVEDSPTACDVQQKVHDTCRGWDDFSNDELSRYYYEMTGTEIDIA
jgi:DNA replicative helicase MCM subunit Mcm2 (Cdc46/Mcm family)